MTETQEERSEELSEVGNNEESDSINENQNLAENQYVPVSQNKDEQSIKELLKHCQKRIWRTLWRIQSTNVYL